MMALWAKLGAWGTATAAAGLGAAVVSGVLPLEDLRDWFTPARQVAVVEQKTPEPTVAKPLIETQEKFAKTEPQAVVPSFDILRVEKNGSVLVAGRAAANSTVELIDATGKVVGTARASQAGEFVILPDSDIAPGDHSFTLRAKTEGQPSVISAQAGVVRVPERNASDDTGVLAMVVEGGLPSRIVATPFEEEIEVAAVAPFANVASDAVPEPALSDDKEGEPAVSTTLAAEVEPEIAVEEVAIDTDVEIAPEAASLEAAESSIPPVIGDAATTVSVEAVEVENETVFVAGAVKQGKSVRVYINNEAIGTARGTRDDRFLVKREFPLEPGSHSVRADVLDPSSGEVTGRAEVPLLHQPLKDPPIETSNVATVSKTETPAEQAASPNYVVPIRTGSAIIIKPGDNLWRISRRNYGQGVRYTTIYEANRGQIRNPNRIYIGQIFKLPHRVQ